MCIFNSMQKYQLLRITQNLSGSHTFSCIHFTGAVSPKWKQFFTQIIIWHDHSKINFLLLQVWWNQMVSHLVNIFTMTTICLLNSIHKHKLQTLIFFPRKLLLLFDCWNNLLNIAVFLICFFFCFWVWNTFYLSLLFCLYN